MCDILESEGVSAASRVCTYEADLRYGGQSLNLPISFDISQLSVVGLKYLQDRFTASHTQLFTFALDLPVEIVNVRVKGKELNSYTTIPKLGRLGTGTPSPSAIKGTTTIYLQGKTYDKVTLWRRGDLKVGDGLEGPWLADFLQSFDFGIHRLIMTFPALSQKWIQTL